MRSFVFDGARSIGMPTVRVVYVIEPDRVVISDAVFEDLEQHVCRPCLSNAAPTRAGGFSRPHTL